VTGLPLVDFVAGARPNFMKVAPVLREVGRRSVLEPRLVHTGQHYDSEMNDVFFSELQIPPPDVHLGAGSGSHGAQTARILEAYEKLLFAQKPDATVVFGDVNSTIACALAAVKLGVPVIHVEAGLRSFDRSMPEEINRILTDAVADLLFVTEESGVTNLRREGVGEARIRLVGNVMIDTLRHEESAARALEMPGRFGLTRGAYALVTLHRPSNVDDADTLGDLIGLLGELAARIPVVFPVHPRTRVALDRLIGAPRLEGVQMIPPLSYRENLGLMAGARLVVTDSGGMQEETTVLGVPCVTIRENTERPITVQLGTSRLVGRRPEAIRAAFADAIEGRWPVGSAIPLWDGRVAQRIVASLEEWLPGS
jgi:UDP-N-acetylglucosamine 2-epimerase (non-hydrolysing)